MPTVLSIGECITNSGFFIVATRSTTRCSLRSSRNCCVIVNGRPARRTHASPRSRISSDESSKRPLTWSASAGAPIVTTARTSAASPAIDRTAAPPSEWPTRICGAACSARNQSIAAAQIGRIGREVRVGELPLAGTQAGEVEAEHGEPRVGQCGRQATDRSEILAARETVREEGKCPRGSGGKVEPGCQLMALAPRERDALDAGRFRRSHGVTVPNPPLPCPRMAGAFS